MVGVLGVLGCASESEWSREDIALEAAEAWLALVDAREYEKSWDEAAAYFKGAVTRAGWQRSMDAVRSPLDANISREVKSRVYNTTMPGAPDGEYVIIRFLSSFKYKKSAIETVATMRDKDGKWRVAGYFLK